MKLSKIFHVLSLAIIFSLLVIAMPSTPARAVTGTIYLSTNNGPVGTSVGVTGAAFTGSTAYTVYLGTDVIASGSTTAEGTFSTSFIIPEKARGGHLITATTLVPDNSNSITFTITPQITLSVTSGYIGAQAMVNGKGFSASSMVTIYFDGTSVGTATTYSNGTFSNVTITIPESYGGSHTIKGTDAYGDSPGITFTTSPKMTVTPNSGAVGAQLTISGNGFAANSTISFYLDNLGVSTTPITTNPNGSFTDSTFTIPPSSRGSHTLKAQDASGAMVTATITVGQKITINPATGASGTTVTVTGSGFGGNTIITIKYNAVAVTTNPPSITSNANGGFAASFNVPAGGAGTYPVEASDGIYAHSANFTIVTSATLSLTTGNVGTEITASGTGFRAGGTATIKYDDIEIAKVAVGTGGTFSHTFKAPKSTHGNHNITISDGSTTMTQVFTMESEAPPIPKPLLPIIDAKEKALAYFDWEDVKDPSGVTYTFQIASNADFKKMVLEKKELTASEYTITEEEKLESTKKKAPYYWRIKAIDGATNESGWTTPGTFYVGFTFDLDLSGWIMWLLAGLGALFIFLIGFVLGKKTGGGGGY